jgi:hypothetical protein
MFSRWIVTNITSARIPCGDHLLVCALYIFLGYSAVCTVELNYTIMLHIANQLTVTRYDSLLNLQACPNP